MRITPMLSGIKRSPISNQLMSQPATMGLNAYCSSGRTWPGDKPAGILGGKSMKNDPWDGRMRPYRTVTNNPLYTQPNDRAGRYH